MTTFSEPIGARLTRPGHVSPDLTDVAPDTEVAAHAPLAPLGTRIMVLLGVGVPTAGLVFAVIMLWGTAIGWVELSLMLAMYAATAMGITIGFHRLFTHRAFDTNRVIKAAFAILGSMAVQGPVLRWVAVHRRHHQCSDTHEDPHSPHTHGRGLWGLIRGAWHSHVGWLFHDDTEDLSRYVGDLRSQRWLRVLSNLFPLWVVLGLLLPALLGGLISWSWQGALMGFVWGGLVRIFVVHHVTWSVNSICHIWGSKPYNSADESRNNPIVGVLAFGEGWHNNHHAFPTSARHGLKWWQFDMSYIVIRTLAIFRLAWNVKLPDRETLQRKSR